MKLAEGTGIEPATLAGNAVAERFLVHSDTLHLCWRRCSVLPRVRQLQRLSPLLSGHRTKWWARVDSNHQDAGSEPAMSAEVASRARKSGGAGRSRTYKGSSPDWFTASPRPVRVYVAVDMVRAVGVEPTTSRISTWRICQGSPTRAKLVGHPGFEPGSVAGFKPAACAVRLMAHDRLVGRSGIEPERT